MSTDSVTFKCKFCPKEFSKNSYCKRHIRNIHKRNSVGELLTEKLKRKFICVVCKKEFAKKWCLQRHITAFHSSERNLHICDQCTFTTVHENNLKRHILTNHIIKLREWKFVCILCGARYTYKKNLKYHERKVHKIGNPPIVVKRVCPICKHTVIGNTVKYIYRHFENCHSILMKWERHDFDSMVKFNDWKCATEKKTTSLYIKKSSSLSTLIYRCHRCGLYKTKGVGKRRIRIKGSCKINGFCPSMIKVKLNENDSLSILYLSTHVGHLTELKHIPLTREERKSSATQIAKRMYDKHISKGIKSPVLNRDLQETHLMNRKHILIVDKGFNLNEECIKHPFDPISIESWVQDFIKTKDTAVLSYKPQGVVSNEFHELNEDDFLLVYMSEAQKSILQTNGNDVICIDGTHSLNDDNFQLYTLLTLDETRECFPTAFMFTNRGDETVLRLFFNELKREVGHVIPNVFMSDMDETFYSAWVKTMGASQFRIFCTWHVLKAWRKNINKKIKIKEKRGSVYKMLQTMLYEVDEDAFNQMLEEVLLNFSIDKDLSVFHDYFMKEYVEKEQYRCWAYSFRVNAGINPNVFMENFNKVLKYCKLRGKHVERLDKTLCAILNLLRDKLFDVMFKIKKGKLATKLQALRKCHQHSLSLEFDKVLVGLAMENKWQVMSSTQSELYTVKRINHCSRCQLLCTHCNSCFHEFVCSCVNSAISNNMCKHIHLVARTTNNSIYDEVVVETSILDTDILEEDKTVVENDILNKVCQESENIISIESKKEKAFNEYKEIMMSIETEDEINLVRNQLKSIIPTLEAMRSEARKSSKDFNN